MENKLYILKDVVSKMWNKKKSKVFLNENIFHNIIGNLIMDFKFNNKTELYNFLLNKYNNKLRIINKEKVVIHEFIKKNKIEKKTRKLIWIVITNTHINMNFYKNYYKFWTSNFDEYHKENKKIINFDILRLYNENYTDNDREIMKRILLNFCKRNFKIGYCQGMNFILEFFYRQDLEEEEIFWIISFLFENTLPPNYYINMITIMFDIKILYKILEIKLPNLYSHIVKFDINLSLFIFKSIIVLCLNIKSNWVKTCIIDELLINSNNIILKFIFLIFQKYKKIFLKKKDIITFKICFEKLFTEFVTDEIDLKNKILSIYINPYILNFIRINGYELKLKKIDKNEININSKKNLCTIYNPFCQHNYKEISKIEHFVFKFKNNFTNLIKFNYLFRQTKRKDIEDSKNILILRNWNFCIYKEKNVYKNYWKNKEMLKYMQKNSLKSLYLDKYDKIYEVELKYKEKKKKIKNEKKFPKIIKKLSKIDSSIFFEKEDLKFDMQNDNLLNDSNILRRESISQVYTYLNNN